MDNLLNAVQAKSLAGVLLGIVCLVGCGPARDWTGTGPERGDELFRLREYASHRASSHDPSGKNDDGNWGAPLAPGERRTLAELPGPGVIRHIWFTFSSREKQFLKRVVLRLIWDDARGPSVRVPVGDFFGLNLGQYVEFESRYVSVASRRALNAFWPMPFFKSARIELENQGRIPLQAFYYNIDYERRRSLPAGAAYFHAAYNQATPTDGTVQGWKTNRDPRILGAKNPDGRGNYVILDTFGRGHYLGVTHGILQKQPDWWGEGDEMIFIDQQPGDSPRALRPRIHGTGAEDYYLGAWCYGSCTGRHDGRPFAYGLYGNPLNGGHKPGARWQVYRFHGQSPLVFRERIRVTIEHGHANHRSDNYYTTAFWYQLPPRALPPLPPVDRRLVR